MGAANNRTSALYYQLALAAIWLFIYELFLDGLVAYPLRLFSAHLAAGTLNFIGLQIKLVGATLTTPLYEFEVSGDCSGSTTLKFMIATALLLLALSKQIGLLRRITALLIALILSLLINGMRVAAIAYMSIITQHPLFEESYGHIITGIIAYALAVCVFYFIFLHLEKTDKPLPRLTKQSINVFILVLGLIIFAPLLDQNLRGFFAGAWNRFAPAEPFLFFSALAILIHAFLKNNHTPQQKNCFIPTVLLIAALALSCFARFISILSLQGLAFFLLAVSLFWGARGRSRLLVATPGFLLLILGLPRSAMVLQNILALTNQSFSTESLIFILRILAEAGLITIYFIVLHYQPKDDYPNNTGTTYTDHPSTYHKLLFPSFFLTTIICLSGISITNGDFKKSSIEISYYLQGWIGKDIAGASGLKSTQEQNMLIARRYTAADKTEFVDLLISSSGGDRKFLHPPEYCFTSAGWKVTEESECTVNNIMLPVLILKRAEETIYMAYWFTDERNVYRFYSSLIFADLYSRLRGRRKDWLTCRVASNNKNNLSLFLQSAGTLLPISQ